MSPLQQPAIQLSGLGVAFGSTEHAVRAFEGVTFSAAAGRFVVLIGPSGCGKSTLLRTVGDLMQASSGSVSVFGADPAQSRRDRRISFVFQDATLLPWRTVLDNVRLPLEVGNWSKLGRDSRRPEDLIELVGLAGREGAYPHELSGGQRQRVSIARALVTNPSVLLMDEPFGALDEITRDRLNDEILKIWRATGTTIVFVTHSLSEAAFLGETVVVMAANPGRILEVIEIERFKPDNRIDRTSSDFFDITSELRRVLQRAYGSAEQL
jgi:NitT/TauT family transport system ATP-binding protein